MMTRESESEIERDSSTRADKESQNFSMTSTLHFIMLCYQNFTSATLQMF